MLIQALFLISFAISFFSTLYVIPSLPAQAGVAEESVVRTTEVLVQATEIPVYTLTPKRKPSEKPTAKPSATPDPTPPTVATGAGGQATPTPDVWSPPDMEPVFARFAGQYGVDKNILERLANCESHFNPNAQNGDYVGLFQFSTSTWINYRQKIGENTDPALRTNIEASIQTAAYLVSQRGTSPWPRCLN